jgi:hypothetical protein
MPDPIDAVLAKVIRETSGWEAIEVHVDIEQTLHIKIGAHVPQTGMASETYIETSKGRRFYQRLNCASPDDCAPSLGYCDGSRSGQVETQPPPNQTKQKTISITKTFMYEQQNGFNHRPTPLRGQYVGLIPLHEALPKALPMGDATVMQRSCQLFHFKAVPTPKGTCELVYSLDTATAVPLRIAFYANTEKLKAAKPQWTWEATELKEIQGFHVPTRSKYSSYAVSEKESTVSLSEVYTMDSVVFNKKYSEATFWPKYDQGVYINDLTINKAYFNTPDKKAPKSVESATAVQEPIVAGDPNAGGSLPLFIGLSVGVVFVVVGLVMWFKRQ